MSVNKTSEDLYAAIASVRALSVQLDTAIEQRELACKEREERWKQLDKKIEQVASQAPSKIVLDVGGKRFAASRSTLLSIPDTFFTALLCSEHWKPNEDGSYFIDRGHKHFERILNYMRTGKLRVADLHKEQLESLQEELDFYQINLPIAEIKIEMPSFIPTPAFSPSNNNKTIQRNSSGHSAVRLDRELQHQGSYEWTIRLDAIVGSHWLVVGVAGINTTSYAQIYGVSSQNQVYPADVSTRTSLDWQSGDLIYVDYKNCAVTITNKRTTKAHTVQVPATDKLYPFFDIYTQGLTVSLVAFK